MTGALLGLLGIAAAVLVWRDAMRAREAAIAACRAVCASYGVQLLDETVALVRLRPAWLRGPGMALRRVYEFEFSERGHDRKGGSIVLLGTHVEAIHLPVSDERPAPPAGPRLI